MEVSLWSGSFTEADLSAVVVGAWEDQPLGGAAATLDAATGGAITRLREAGELKGALGETTPLFAPPCVRAPLALVVGLGQPAEFDRAAAFRAAATAAKFVAGKPRPRVAFALGEDWTPAQQESGVAGAIVGGTGQDLYREKKNLHPPEALAWLGADDATLAAGRILGEAVNFARRLVNEPPSAMYPESFAAEVLRVADGCGLECEIWDESRLANERCGALLAVGQASARPPRLTILKHSGGPPGQPPLAFVGKGVTFDSGGLSIKPADSMTTMKCDMAGAAAVVAAMEAIARLKLPVNVIGLCGLVENLLGGRSYKVGDVLRARSGKTIEVLNTDAEGRLVLADVLDVACERGAAKIVDLATLTGACVVALGNDVAGAMTNDEAWCAGVLAAAKACGERLWQLPMDRDYADQIKSQVAEIKNVGDGRWGGAITAAKFLEEFVRGVPWVHLDVAGPAFSEKAKPALDAGGTGFGVRTLVELARG